MSAPPSSAGASQVRDRRLLLAFVTLKLVGFPGFSETRKIHKICLKMIVSHISKWIVCLLLPQGSFAMTGAVGSLGGPWPTLFSADTLNSYSFPSTRSNTSASVTSALFFHLAASQHEPEVKRRSMWYAVTSLPPSLTGGSHDSLQWVLNMSRTCSSRGGPGGSVGERGGGGKTKLLVKNGC